MESHDIKIKTWELKHGKGSFHVMVGDLGPRLPPFCIRDHLLLKFQAKKMGHWEPPYFFFFFPPCCRYCCFEVGFCYTDLVTLNLQYRLQEPWICGHLSAVRTAAMHHRAWSLCLCFGDRLQLWCLSTCWPNTLTLSAKSGAEGRQSKSRREGHSICCQHLSSNSGDYSCSIMYHHPPQWVTTVQQAFKLDREQQLSKHTNRGADSLEAGLQTLKWPLSKSKTVGFNHDSGETGELGTRRR